MAYLKPVEFLSNGFYAACESAGYTLDMSVRAVTKLTLVGRKKNEVINQTFLVVFGSIPITFVTAMFSGMILALQTGIELAKYGQTSAIGFVVGASMCREMGPVFTAIAVSGLVGSAMCAEIATMKVSEEIDALECMSIDPVYYLVMPRLIALAIGMPLLVIFSDAIGIIAGGMTAKSMFNEDFELYMKNAKEILKLKDVYGGLLKAFVFGTTICTVACGQGLQTEHGSEGVGRSTLRTVVISFLLILFFDYVLTWIIYQ